MYKEIQEGWGVCNNCKKSYYAEKSNIPLKTLDMILPVLHAVQQ